MYRRQSQDSAEGREQLYVGCLIAVQYGINVRSESKEVEVRDMSRRICTTRKLGKHECRKQEASICVAGTRGRRLARLGLSSRGWKR